MRGSVWGLEVDELGCECEAVPAALVALPVGDICPVGVFPWWPVVGFLGVAVGAVCGVVWVCGAWPGAGVAFLGLAVLAGIALVSLAGVGLLVGSWVVVRWGWDDLSRGGGSLGGSGDRGEGRVPGVG